jgi:sugar-specific transcriptional regulator TrmB
MGADTSTLGELVERLGAIGLEPKDALLYLHLCLQGPTKASEAAAASKLNRTEAYRALDHLIRRGFVTASLDRPTLYEATAPEKVFDDALAHHVARKQSIERARETTLAMLTQLRDKVPDQGPLKASYKILQGRSAIYNAVDGMIRRARHSQRMVSTFFAPTNATDENAPYRTTVQRADGGLRMQLLVRDVPGMDKALAGIAGSPHVQVRTFEPSHTVRFTVVDDREVIVWLANDPSPSLAARDDVAMWTNAGDFVKNQLTLYDALWSRGRDVGKAPRRGGGRP